MNGNFLKVSSFLALFHAHFCFPANETNSSVVGKCLPTKVLPIYILIEDSMVTAQNTRPHGLRIFQSRQSYFTFILIYQHLYILLGPKDRMGWLRCALER